MTTARTEAEAEGFLRRQMSAGREPLRPAPAQPARPAPAGQQAGLGREGGSGILRRLDDLEAAVKELALEEPRWFEQKLADFREALKRLVAAAESNEARLRHLEEIVG